MMVIPGCVHVLLPGHLALISFLYDNLGTLPGFVVQSSCSEDTGGFTIFVLIKHNVPIVFDEAALSECTVEGTESVLLKLKLTKVHRNSLQGKNTVES
jgi:hypothetical protein